MRLRLVDTGLGGAFPGALNMAIDESVLESVSRGDSPPALRFYRWSPPCVTVGYFQSLEAEVDLDACQKAGVDAVRRLTGGGAVFHDREITYSLVLPLGHPLAPDDILESYRLICSGIIRGLSKLGVTAVFEPINDIAAGGKKISGNAQTRRQGCLLQHGTVLLGLDPERMFSLLKVPAEKMKGRLVEEVKARVTSLSAVLGREVGYEEAVKALTLGCEQAWGATLETRALGPDEERDARRKAVERFSNPDWNRRR